jgi:hypothetical protein
MAVLGFIDYRMLPTDDLVTGMLQFVHECFTAQWSLYVPHSGHYM